MNAVGINQGHRSFSLTPKLLDQYVAREFLVSYLIAIFVVLLLRILIDLFLNVDEFVEVRSGQAPPAAWLVLTHVLRYYGPKTLEYFRDFSGTIILLAAAFSLARMTRQNELTAVLASGVSLKRIIAPIVFLAVGLNFLMVLDQEMVLPQLADRLVRNPDEMGRARAVSIWLLPDQNEALFSARQYDPKTQTLSHLTVILRRDRQAVGLINAVSARWDNKQQAWILEKGQYLDADERTRGGDEPKAKPIERYASSLTPDFLWLQRNSHFKSLMSTAELSNLMRRNLTSTERADTISEKHFRFTDPIINMVMLLLGLPMLVSRERRNTKTALLLALAGAGGCFVVTFVCKLLAGGIMDPLLAAWLPIIVFLPLSVLVLDGLKT